MRRLGKFTSLGILVLVTTGAEAAQPWPPWANEFPGRRWQEDIEPRPLPPQRDFSAEQRNDNQNGGDIRSGGARPEIAPVAPPVVAISYGFAANSIVIDTGARKLYYVLPDNRAYVYPISVGREGFNWSGTERVSRKQPWPDWYPPAEMRERDSSLPEKMTGGLKNPLGAMAIYLGNTLYRIHGTNDVKSIGRAQSSGCFRMLNSAVMHLASITAIGTSVSVVPSLPKAQEISRGPETEPAATALQQPVNAAPPATQAANEAPVPDPARDYRSLRDYTLSR